MYHSVESWKLNLLLKRMLKGTLTIHGDYTHIEDGCAEVLGQLINGYPPIQIFVHKGKIVSEYFSVLYTALTEEDVAVIEVNTLEVISGWDKGGIETNKTVIPITDLMSTIKFFEATKDFDQKTTHRLSMAATKLYETVFPVIKVDDEFNADDLTKYLDQWLI